MFMKLSKTLLASLESIFCIFFYFVDLPNRDPCDLKGGSEGLHPVLERSEQGNYRGANTTHPYNQSVLTGPSQPLHVYGALSGGWGTANLSWNMPGT